MRRLLNNLQNLAARWGSGITRRKARRNAEALDWIKAQYHIFRVLLANNDRALALLAEADRLLRENEPSQLAGVLRDAQNLVLELIDGLNRLTQNGHVELYARVERLCPKIDQALEKFKSDPRDVWLPLAEATRGLLSQVGGKAQPLGSLLRAGLPVAEGLVITRRACRAFIRDARLEERLKALLRSANEPGAAIEPIAEQAQAMLRAAAPSPAFERQLREAWEYLARGNTAVAARSSAVGEDGGTHSFAGQYASVLGIRDFKSFVEGFKTVLASAFSARALSYRLRAGLAPESLDMAVLCQQMIDARSSGVAFSLDPTAAESNRMLITAAPGLGELVVSGRAPNDVYRPCRERDVERIEDTPAEIADKTLRAVMDEVGGIREEATDTASRYGPSLKAMELATLRDMALRIEALRGGPQDIEWSIDHKGSLWILQARPARMASAGLAKAAADGQTLLSDGVPASPGQAVGQVVIVRSRQELELATRPIAEGQPIVLVLHQSLVDAAPLLADAAAVLVDLGNPLDHLSCLAREQGAPMLTGLGTATTQLVPGSWVLVDADRGLVQGADPALWRATQRTTASAGAAPSSAAASLRNLLLPLHLTDAYGPTFSIRECRSLHDLIRYTHEKAVIALFESGDAITENAFGLVRRLRDASGLSFLLIDLGGGLDPSDGKDISLEAVRSEPLAALCRGMAEPGLRWSTPPPVAGLDGLMSRSLLDGRSERPVGNPNYALISRDYLNLNARVDYHFAMLDAICGPNPRENSIRFRFKGGGTALIQRERRARFVEAVLQEHEFFTNRAGDMVGATFAEGPRESIQEKIEMLGRFLGFSRLLDATMLDDETPVRLARAFLEGDYALEAFTAEQAQRQGATDHT